MRTSFASLSSKTGTITWLKLGQRTTMSCKTSDVDIRQRKGPIEVVIIMNPTKAAGPVCNPLLTYLYLA